MPTTCARKRYVVRIRMWGYSILSLYPAGHASFRFFASPFATESRAFLRRGGMLSARAAVVGDAACPTANHVTEIMSCYQCLALHSQCSLPCRFCVWVLTGPFCILPRNLKITARPLVFRYNPCSIPCGGREGELGSRKSEVCSMGRLPSCRLPATCSWFLFSAWRART